jgi:hypothetical protein
MDGECLMGMTREHLLSLHPADLPDKDEARVNGGEEGITRVLGDRHHPLDL